MIYKLSQESDMLRVYGKIKDQEKKRIEKDENSTDKIHCVWHHAVRMDSPTTPIVYDCRKFREIKFE